MEKKIEVSEQNFSEGKAVHYLRSVKAVYLRSVKAKLSFMIRSFKKWREVMVVSFFNSVLKKVLKMNFENVWEPCLF